jgi:hypothetical protein
MNPTKTQSRHIDTETVSSKHQNVHVLQEIAMINRVKKWMKGFPSKARLFFRNLKQEIEESAWLAGNLARLVSGHKLHSSEIEMINRQIADVAKGTIIGAAVMSPGGSLIAPFLIKTAKKMGIDLVPSAFKNNDIKESEKNREKIDILKEYVKRVLDESAKK